MAKKSISNFLKALFIPFSLVIIWQVLVDRGIFPKDIASPIKTAQVFYDLSTNQDYYLLNNIKSSFKRLITGYSFGTFFGIVLGLVLGYYKKIGKYLTPSILTLIPVPPMAWLTFIIVFFGTGEIMKILLISVGSFSTLFLVVLYSVKNISKNLIELGDALGKSDLDKIKSIVLPSITPYIFSSMRVAMALSWTLLLAAEIVQANSGLGWMIFDARQFGRSGEMISGIIIIGILGMLSDKLILYFSKKLRRYDTSLEVEKS
jgi:sulfonate transport system permease protein